MLSAPTGLSTDDIRAALADGWGIEGRAVEYRAVGFGSHHWAVNGAEWFVTADRTDPHLEAALRTAVALRAAGLEFVVAPIVTRGGAATQPAGKGYLLAVYPHVEGTAGDFGPHDPDDKTEIYGLLDRLHATKASTAEPLDLELPLRDELHAGKVGDGPYGQRSHDLLRDRRGLIDDLLVEYDRLKGTLPPRDEWVVTHGEPHPGNFMRTREGLRLVDWDTVRLAPRERDLWLVDDRPAYAFFRLRWKLADITVSARDLSLPHSNTEDMSATFGYLREYLAYDST